MEPLESAIQGVLSRLQAITTRLEVVEKQLTSNASGSSSSGAPASSSIATGGEISSSVIEYDDLIGQFIKNYVNLSGLLGSSEVAQQAAFVLDAVQKQREFLEIASNCKKPNDEVFQKLLKPTSDLIVKIVELKDSNRSSKFFNHLSAVAEGISALSWVCVSPTPGPHVADMRSGSEFYSNRILKEFKGKDQTQVDWVNAYNGFLKELQVYIKKHHTTGLSWNAKGSDAAVYAVGTVSSGSTVPPPGPPPPPPPIAPLPNATASGNNNPPDMSNVFSELNRGEAITSGLKKVTADMKTKNRTEKVSVVSASKTNASTASTGKKTQEVQKPPVLSLEGNKWRVEYQVNNKNIVIDNAEVKQTIYIYRCKDSVIQVKGKVNSIAVDDCQKTAIVFENAIASFEVVNCRSIEIQVIGKVPNFAIDKTSGCQLYLSKESLGAEIVTSKSDQMNVLLPSDDGDVVEIPIPEQYKTFVQNGQLITHPLEHKG